MTLKILFLKISRRFSSPRVNKKILVQGPSEFGTVQFDGVLPLNKRTALRYKSVFPSSTNSILAHAQRIRLHQFEYLGHQYIFDGKIRWHLDPVSNKEWLRKKYDEVNLFYDGSPADPKLVWELNRHQYFVTLAQGFYLSRDRVHLDELLSQWIDWINDNPFRVGINWASPLEIGIRLISWIFAFQFVEAAVGPTERSKILHSIWQQASFLSSHLSLDKIVHTNHLIGEATGLFIAACSFSFRESSRWRKRALQILEAEIHDQVFSDGAVKEQSSSYQRFDTELLLLVYFTAGSRSLKISEGFEERLRRMIRYLALIETPDGTLPPVGDSDNGRGFLLNPSTSLWDIRGSIILGSNLVHGISTERPNEDAFWFLSEEGFNMRNRTSEERQVSPLTIFSDSGHVVFRFSSDYCFLRSGPFGLGGKGFSSHSHNDLFSPIMYIHGQLVLTDTGTSIYLGNDEERDYLRSAEAHNTAVAHGWNYFRVRPGFGWRNCTDGQILRSSDSEPAFVECGFKGTRTPYRRKITHLRGKHAFLIEDTFFEQIEEVRFFFHLAAGLHPILGEKAIEIMKEGRHVARLMYPTSLTGSIVEGWLAPSYGKKTPATIVRFMGTVQPKIPVEFEISSSGSTV